MMNEQSILDEIRLSSKDNLSIFLGAFGRKVFGALCRTRKARPVWRNEAMAVAVLITRWKARGLTEAVLQGIRTDVFNVAAPIGPVALPRKAGQS